MISIYQNAEIRGHLDECAHKIAGLFSSHLMVSVSLYVRPAADSRPFNEETIKQIVCDACNVKWDDVKSVSKEQSLVTARKIYAWVAITYLRQSLQKIATALGRTNHTSVVHYREALRDHLAVNDRMYADPFEQVTSRLDTLIKMDSETNGSKG